MRTQPPDSAGGSTVVPVMNHNKWSWFSCFWYLWSIISLCIHGHISSLQLHRSRNQTGHCTPHRECSDRLPFRGWTIDNPPCHCTFLCIPQVCQWQRSLQKHPCTWMPRGILLQDTWGWKTYDMIMFWAIWSFGKEHSKYLKKLVSVFDFSVSTYPFSPLMHSGHGSTAGGSMPTSVQLAKSMQSSKAGSHDHQLHSSFLPQNLWHPSASWVTLKSREYSLKRNFIFSLKNP